MSRIRFKQVDEISRTTVSCAQNAFLKHCKLKNLSSYTSLYYEKNLDYFLESEPQIKYVDEIDQELIEDYMSAPFLPSKRPIASAKSGNEPLPVRIIHRDLNDREQHQKGNKGSACKE